MKAFALKPLSIRAPLEKYETQAASLLAAFEANDPRAFQPIRQHHPRLRGRANTNERNPITVADVQRAGFSIDDARAVIAGWHGFAGWEDIRKHAVEIARKDSSVLKFERCVEAIIHGDATALKALLRANPNLIRERSTRAHRATLLHYVGANGVEDYRQITPKNAVAILKILLGAGAEVDADLDYTRLPEPYPERRGSTTLGLVATSCHPANAGVQIPLLQELLKAGADIDGLPKGWNPLIAALHNGRGEAAKFLAEHGARLDVEGAAGTGSLRALRRLLQKNRDLRQMELGFQWACEYGHVATARLLINEGIDVSAMPHGETGLHWASLGGHLPLVKMLLKQGAPVTLRDKRFGGTPLGWALHGWCYRPPRVRSANYYPVVKLLIGAGATAPKIENLDAAQRALLKKESRMRAALRD